MIAAALRHERAPWPERATEDLATSVLAAAHDHGVAALLSATPAVEGWPERVRGALTDERRSEAVVEALRRQELLSLLGEFRAAGISVLLLKGAQIAYTHYHRPWLRPRLDTDLLIAPRDRSRADEMLRRLGYRPKTDFSGELVTHQFQYERRNQYGLSDTIDLHWKIANPHVFAEMFAFEELERDALPIASLEANARGLSDAHAFVVACMHRVAHHDNSDRLIWLYDIHLLINSMDAECRAKVAELAATKRLRSVCARGISSAQARFGTSVPRDWLDRLQRVSDGEPAAAYLQTDRRKVDILIDDLRTLRGWRPKFRLLREHLFPPPAYMRRIYGSTNPILLPFAYVDRVVSGVGKWFRRPR